MSSSGLSHGLNLNSMQSSHEKRWLNFFICIYTIQETNGINQNAPYKFDQSMILTKIKIFMAMKRRQQDTENMILTQDLFADDGSVWCWGYNICILSNAFTRMVVHSVQKLLSMLTRLASIHFSS